MKSFLLIISLLFAAVPAWAQLSITVSPVKVTGQKAVVPLALKNNFTENIESARAACFLLDEQGKMIGQGTRWIVGGAREPEAGGRKPEVGGLSAGATNAFHFVIPLTQNNPRESVKSVSTNLTAKVTVNRLVLEGGKLADPIKDVQIGHER